MDIKYVTGDLIDGDQTIIVHGCNSRGAFQSGVAGQIRSKLPFAFEAYRLAFDDLDSDFDLGRVIWAISVTSGHRPRIVGNMITQRDYGRRSDRRYVDYDAVREAIRAINRFVGLIQDQTISIPQIGDIAEVGMPLIGCGLGNGSWATISRIIVEESHCFLPVVYLLDGTIPVD